MCLLAIGERTSRLESRSLVTRRVAPQVKSQVNLPAALVFSLVPRYPRSARRDRYSRAPYGALGNSCLRRTDSRWRSTSADLGRPTTASDVLACGAGMLASLEISSLRSTRQVFSRALRRAREFLPAAD